MRYESTYIDAERTEVEDRISRRVTNIRREVDEDVSNYYTNVGVHLAAVSDVTLGDGTTGTKLRYRTDYVRPHLVHAKNKAVKIRDAALD
jgi:hypothetical protein